MSASLGELVISIAADIAKLQEGMSRAEVVAMRTSQKIDQAMKIASDSIAGVAAGFLSFKAVEGFASSIEGAIDAAAALQKLSESTGVAATSLSALKGIAKQSGTDITEVAAGLQRMSRSVTETSMGTGRAALAIKALGLNARDMAKLLPEQQMLIFAQKLMGLENETLKVGLAMKIFRDPNLLPFLKDLADAGELNGKVTNKQAREAEEYERALRSLTGAKKEFYNVIAEQVTPALTVLVRVITGVWTEADGLNDTVKKLAAQNQMRQWAFEAALAIGYVIDGLRTIWSGIQAVGSAVGLVALYFVESFRNIGTVIGVVAGIFKDFGGIIAGVDLIYKGFWTEGAALIQGSVANISAGVGQIKDRFVESFTTLGQSGKEFFENFGMRADDLAKGSWADSIYNQIAKVTNSVDKLAKSGKGHADATKLVTDAYDGLIKKLDLTAVKLQTELTFMQKHGYATKETEVAVTKAALEEANMAKVLQERAVREGTTVETLKAKAMAQAAVVDVTRHQLELETEYVSGVKSENEELGNTIEKLKEQAATYGQTEDAVTRYRIAQKEALRDTFLAIDPMSKAAKDLQYQIDQLYQIANRQGTFQWMRNFVDAVKEGAEWVGKIAVGFLDGVSHGIANAREMLKQFLRDLIAMVAKKWFLQFVAGAVGGTAGTAIAGQAAQVGANSVTGLVGSAAASYAGGLMSAGAGEMVGLVGTEFAANVATLGVAMEAGAAAVGGFAEVIAAAIPVVGWIVAIGIALYAIFGNKGGGPKGGGSAFGTFDAAGNMQQNLLSSVDRSRFLQDETQADSLMGPIVGKVAASFYNILHHLGGTGGEGMQFGLGYNMDPAGSAPSMVSSLLRNSQGQQIFAQSNRDVGRTQQEVSAEMQLQAQQMILAALQASDLPKEIADILDTVSAQTGTAEQIQAVLQAAQEAYNVMQALKVLDIKGLDLTSLHAFQLEGETISQTFQRVAQTWAQFNDAFMSDAQKIQAAQDQVNDAFANLGVAIPQSKEEFYNLVHSLDLSTEAGRNMFAVLMQISPAFLQVTNAAAAAVQQFYSLATQLSASFGQSYARMNLDAAIAAWRAVDTNIGADFDVEGALRQIIASGSFSAVLPYIQSLGSGALAVFNSLLAAYQAWQQSMNTGSGTPSMPLPTMPGLPTGPIEDFSNALEQAISHLKDFVDSMMINSQLSPLTPRQQLAEAAAQFQHLVGLAKGGDIDSINQLPAAAQAYLEIARSIFKSSGDYNSIFQMVHDLLESIAGGGGTGKTSLAPTSDVPLAITNSGQVVQESVDKTTQAINELISLIARGISVSDSAAQQKLDEISTELASRGGVLG